MQYAIRSFLILEPSPLFFISTDCLTLNSLIWQFSLNRVKLLEGALDEQIGNWMSVLREQAVQNSLVDWAIWARQVSSMKSVNPVPRAYDLYYRYFSFDAVTAVSFGDPVGFLDARSDVRGLIENMDKAMYLQTLSLYPPVSWFARNTALGRWIFVSQRTDKEGLGLFMAVGLYLLGSL
jgi:hypothetical protein